MSVQIVRRNQSEVLVVDLAGRLDTTSSGQASDEFDVIVGGGDSKILLNLERLEFISSAGLRIVLRAAKQLRGNGGEMKLCNARGIVAEVLEVSGFSNLIHLCDSERAALEAF